MAEYRKVTVPGINYLNERVDREGEAVFEIGPFAVLRFVVGGSRSYTVTHLPTGLKTHTDQWQDFEDGYAAIELAREMHETFPDADKWTATNANGELPKRSVVREIVMRHLDPIPIPPPEPPR